MPRNDISLMLVHLSNKRAIVYKLIAKSSINYYRLNSNSIEILELRVFLDLNGIDILGISLIICWKRGLSITEKAISSATIHRIKFFSNSSIDDLVL